jgi:DNA repair protein RecN (Recombination protein N)
MEDVVNNIRTYTESVNFDPNELSDIDNRIAEVNGLKRKYGNSLQAILSKKEQIEKRFLDFDNSAFQKESLQKEIFEIQNDISKLAVTLAKKREKAGKTFKNEVERELKELNMERVTFEPMFSYKESEDSFVSFNGKKSDINSLGIGEVEFFFSSNAGEEVKPLAKIASGGELSRIMLALKKVLAGKDSVPVLVFDEIDTGISGGTAEIVGKKIKEVAKAHQVFCVTHLPQIASKGDAHFLIRKQVSKNKTVVDAVKISGSSRVDEIARMAGGIKITETTRKHAHEMITGSN